MSKSKRAERDSEYTAHLRAVASLGLVSSGAATDGVTPIFPEKKLTAFFSNRRLQRDDLF